jgi:hypothetical protein
MKILSLFSEMRPAVGQYKVSPLCFYFKSVMQINHINFTLKLGWVHCSGLHVRGRIPFAMPQFRWLWMVPRKWSLVRSASLSDMIELWEGVWSRPIYSWDRLIMPLPLEYDTWSCWKYTQDSFFIHCEHSFMIKTHIVFFWEFHPARVFFSNRGLYSIMQQTRGDRYVRVVSMLSAFRRWNSYTQ